VSGDLRRRCHACGDDLRVDGVPKVLSVEPTALPRYQLVSFSLGAHPCFYFCDVGRVTPVIAFYVYPCRYVRASSRDGQCALTMSWPVVPHHSQWVSTSHRPFFPSVARPPYLLESGPCSYSEDAHSIPRPPEPITPHCDCQSDELCVARSLCWALARQVWTCFMSVLHERIVKSMSTSFAQAT
jgi:hypothetical protein